MKHVFTTREKALIIVLAVIILGFCYYNFFLSPINDEISNYNAEASVLESELTINSVKSAQRNAMADQIEELKAQGATTIPEYNNNQNVMMELNSILQGALDYSISFDATSNIDYVVLRPAYLTVTTSTYAEMRAIIDKLYASSNKMRMSDLNITISEKDGTVTANMRITYFEVDQNYSAPVVTSDAEE